MIAAEIINSSKVTCVILKRDINERVMTKKSVSRCFEFFHSFFYLISDMDIVILITFYGPVVSTIGF